METGPAAKPCYGGQSGFVTRNRRGTNSSSVWHEEVKRVRVVGVVKRVDAVSAIGDVRCCRDVQNSLSANGGIRGAGQPDNEDFFRTRSDTLSCQQVTLAIDRHGRV